MLKNELSIKAQHSYDVAIKIVEHREKLIKQKTAESISHYKSLVSFKNSKSEAILFAKRKELLKDNIEALFTKNSLDAKVALLKNNKDFHRFNWSFVKIDRNNPNKEAVKKQEKVEVQKETNLNIEVVNKDELTDIEEHAALDFLKEITEKMINHFKDRYLVHSLIYDINNRLETIGVLCFENVR